MKSGFDYKVGGIFPVLPFLFVLSLLTIILLTIALCHYKRRLRRSQEYLVRYITYCLELKKQVPTSERPYSFNPPEITCEEFIKIIDNMLKRMMFLPLFVLLALPLGAQEKADHEFSLRFNLLHWATLTADFGMEYRIDSRWAILADGTFANWGWKDKDRRFRIWKVSPEVRYHLGEKRRGFLGAMYHIGEFNYKLGETGKRGDYQGGGITGGYLLPLTSSLGLDFHAALGYTCIEYDKYTRIGGVNVRENKHGKLVKHYWGINQLGISLLWKL